MSKPNFGVILLCYNEEKKLPQFIECIHSFGLQIYCVDSYSNDSSMKILDAAGVPCVQRKFESFAAQRNFTLKYYSREIQAYKGILFLDADETLTHPLFAEITNFLQQIPTPTLGRIAPLNILNGRTIKHASRFPVYHDRLIGLPVNGEFRVARSGHGEYFQCHDGKSQTLREPYLHDAFHQGFEFWLKKHLDLATKEVANVTTPPRTFKERIVAISRGTPLSPILRFVYLYFFRLGFLDGKAGLNYAYRYLIYEAAIYLLTDEKQ